MRRTKVNALESIVLAALILVCSPNTFASGDEGSSVFKQMVQLEPGNSLVEVARDTFGDSKIYRYQQHYLDVPIHGRHIRIRESSAGDTISMYGAVVNGLSESLPSVQPHISERDAKRAARKKFRAASPIAYDISRQRAGLEILVDQENRGKLVYVVTFLAQSEFADPKVPMTIVDATSGEVMSQHNTAASAKFNGTGPGGNPNTGRIEYGANAEYLDIRRKDDTCYLRNEYVRVANMHGLPGYPSPGTHSFRCPRNVVREVNGAYSPMNDLLYFGTSIFEMYQTYLGVRVIPAPYRIKFRAHYNNRHTAVWAGKENIVVIGNGDDEHYPNAVMDIVSHELAHGFTDYSSGLNRDWKRESSAIDEAFADMAGEAFEHYMRGSNHFVLGEDASKSGTPARDMRNPPRFKNGIDHIDDYRAELKVAPKGEIDPHRASGIYNKAFYLLATSPGWDTKQAFVLFARANQWYWSPDTDFEQGACITIRTATELGYPAKPVEKAFEQVGITCGVNWEKDTATGFFSSAMPEVLDSGKTLDSPPEPANGEWIYAARTDRSISNGRRYIELRISEHAAAKVFPYSGFISLVLQTEEHGVEYDVDYTLGQMLTLGWALDVESAPVAAGPAWLWANSNQDPVYNRSPMGSASVGKDSVIGIAVDLDAGKVWYSLNGVWKGDPVTGVDPAFDQAVLSSEYHITGRNVRLKALGEFADLKVTLQSTSATFDYPVPSGYSAW